ncbi:unnamed protein product, partial [Gongylonema pulchrum]|uniref:PHB domain-containing protein n=1 Tax=Gongylonema pulchrum TaxID=637853 RepID=A0A183DG20_9BILA
MLITIVKLFRPVFFVISRIYFNAVSVFFTALYYFIPKRMVEAPRDNLLLISATQAAEMIRKREIKSRTLVETYIRRIEEVNGIINAVVQKNFEEALIKSQE